MRLRQSCTKDRSRSRFGFDNAGFAVTDLTQAMPPLPFIISPVVASLVKLERMSRYWLGGSIICAFQTYVLLYERCLEAAQQYGQPRITALNYMETGEFWRQYWSAFSLTYCKSLRPASSLISSESTGARNVLKMTKFNCRPIATVAPSNIS
jgi:hypothetical protein